MTVSAILSALLFSNHTSHCTAFADRRSSALVPAHASVPPGAAARVRYETCTLALAALESAEYRVLAADGSEISRVWRSFARRAPDRMPEPPTASDSRSRLERTRIEGTNGRVFISDGARAILIDERTKTFREFDSSAGEREAAVSLSRDWWLLELRSQGLVSALLRTKPAGEAEGRPVAVPDLPGEIFEEVAAPTAPEDDAAAAASTDIDIVRRSLETVAIASIGGRDHEVPLEIVDTLVIGRADSLPRRLSRRSTTGIAKNRHERAQSDEFLLEFLSTDRAIESSRFTVPTRAELESKGYTERKPHAAPRSANAPPATND